jgi:arabinogalactan endo-1,4-beta-galactosidase
MVSALDYDIIGLSFYPIWHGKSLMELEQTMIDLSIEFSKPVVIAETAYPFTLDWNDQTHNIVGLQSQLILPDYPASPEGQKLFIRDLRNMVNSNESMLGFCYWGAELVAWKGFDSLDASPWENQALFDFNNHALPVLDEFSN